MHISSGRWVYGLFLALLTAFLWGILPIKLKQVLLVMDPVTVTWFRLMVSGGCLFIYLAATRRLPSRKVLGPRGGWLVVMAVLGLVGNYILYLMGLNLLSPGTAQLVVQMGPIMLLIASLFVFKERFSVGQGIGLLVLLIGFGLFFNQRLVELFTSLSDYTAGVLLVLLASTVWTFYALGQKQLLTVWNSWLLLACCMNTLIAYGAFAEALAHWEASRVSATLAITPLVTFAAVAMAAWLWPEYVHAETINGLGYGGAVLVVLGSALVALGPSLIAGLKARKVRMAAS